MPRTSDAKQKAIQTAIRLFRQQGYHGTGLTQILNESGAPKGSFYFHFPQGKIQLACAVLETVGPLVSKIIDAAAEASENSVVFVNQVSDTFYKELEASNYQSGCPVAALANEVSVDSIEIRKAVSKVLNMWQRSIAKGLEAHSISPSIALPLSGTILNAIEGATMLSKAHRSRTPFDQLQTSLSALLVANQSNT